MKRCSTLHEGSTKLNEAPLQLPKWSKSRTLILPNVKDAEQEPKYTAGENAKWQPLCKSLAFIYKTCYRTIQQLSLHTYSKGVENINAKSYTWMLIAALLVINKAWKQPRRPSVSEWINCGTSNRVFYSALKKKSTKTWKNLKHVLLQLKCLYTVSFQCITFWKW